MPYKSISSLVITTLIFAINAQTQLTVPKPINGSSANSADTIAATRAPAPKSKLQNSQDAQFGSRRNQNPSPEEEKMLKEQKKIQNKERFEALKKDTDKLVALATELKTNVDKANENMLSLDVIKKSEEIEKLAKKVREKMTNAY